MDISRILGNLAKKLRDFSEEDITKLEKGEFEISFKKINSPKYALQTSGKKKALNSLRESDIQDIVGKLKNSSSRDESQSILCGREVTVSVLSEIAKQLDIPYRSEDKKEHLVDRIVENTIGYKVRSDAVRGNYSESKVMDQMN